MKRFVWLFSFAMLVMAAAWGAEPKETPEYLFQKAMYLETAKADYQGAIPVYETIMKDYESNAVFAVKSLYRLGICYEKTGNPEKAEQCARKLVQEHVDAVNADTEIAEFTYRHLGPVVHGKIKSEEIVVMTTGREQITDKLNMIILPSVEFKDAHLVEVVSTLMDQSMIYDKSPTPEPKGISFGIMEGIYDTNAPREKQQHPRVTISLKNVSLMNALESITKSIGYQFIVEDSCVVLTPPEKIPCK